MTVFLYTAVLCSFFLLFLTHHVASSSDYLPLVGNNCNPNNTRLLVDNNQLKSDCGYVGWCDASDSTCKVRGCRRDEWPFGFNKVDRSLWPPLCSHHQFCPDEGSYCMEQRGIGQPCQLSRDDECVQSASPGGVKCLHNICVAVNATLGTNCTIENTIYTDFTDRENDYGDIISRDNCVSGLYCDAPTTQCKQQLATGSSCSADKECITGYCFDKTYLATIPVNNNATGKCGDDPIMTKSRSYVYIIIALLIAVSIVGLGVWLVKVHLQQTKVKKAAREEYWQGQRSISGKAKLIDESVRINSDPNLSASHPLLASLRSSSQSTRTTNSTTPLRKETKLQHPERYGEHRRRQDSSNYRGGYQQDGHGSSSDADFTNQYNDGRGEGFVTPSQSLSTLSLLEAYSSPSPPPNGSSGATSSAVDPFTITSDYVRSRDNTRGRTDHGWQSPDHRI